MPISVDTCRASVAKSALELDVDVINDISGLKYDVQMPKIIEKYNPSVILCAYGTRVISGSHVLITKKLLNESVKIAQKCNISPGRIVLDPAIGFFRRSSEVKNKMPYTKINSDWAQRDIEIIKNLKYLKTKYPILVSISNKSFLGKLLEKDVLAIKKVTSSGQKPVLAILGGAKISSKIPILKNIIKIS